MVHMNQSGRPSKYFFNLFKSIYYHFYFDCFPQSAASLVTRTENSSAKTSGCGTQWDTSEYINLLDNKISTEQKFYDINTKHNTYKIW